MSLMTEPQTTAKTAQPDRDTRGATDYALVLGLLILTLSAALKPLAVHYTAAQPTPQPAATATA